VTEKALAHWGLLSPKIIPAYVNIVITSALLFQVISFLDAS
jgi:hypothetical protein